MTWKKWSRELKRFLSPLPKSERQTIVAYYREIFEDKLDLGLTEQELANIQEICLNNNITIKEYLLKKLKE